MPYITAYFIATLAFFAIDMLWLGKIANGFYDDQIGHLRGDKVNFVAAIIFYLIYIVGIVIFAVKPAIAVESVLTALLYGSLFGFFCYSTYEFTNLATLKDWPLKVVIIDVIWGTILTGSVACISAWVTLKLL